MGIPNLFAEKEPKAEGAAIERWGKIYTGMYILSVIGGVAGIVGSIAVGGSDTIQYEPRGYDQTAAEATSVKMEKVFSLKADPNKKDVTCFCRKQPAGGSSTNVVYRQFLSQYELPQYKLCANPQDGPAPKSSIFSINFEECLTYETYAQAEKAGVICPPGMMKDTIYDPLDGVLGKVNGAGVTRFVDYLQTQCTTSKNLVDSIVRNTLNTVVDEDNRFLEKEALERKVKSLMKSGYEGVQPLWESQLHAHKAVAAFNSPAQVLGIHGTVNEGSTRMQGGDKTVEVLSGGAAGASGDEGGSCTDDDTKVKTDSKGEIENCAAGLNFKGDNLCHTNPEGVPDGWFRGLCCATCTRLDGDELKQRTLYFTTSAPNLLGGFYQGFDKMGHFMGSVNGIKVGWDQTREEFKPTDTQLLKNGETERGGATKTSNNEYFFHEDGLRGFGQTLRESVQKYPDHAWWHIWQSMIEVGTQGGFFKDDKSKGWIDGAGEMYLDMAKILGEDNQLHVEVKDGQYDEYFSACAPTHCTFVQHQGVDPNVMLVAVLGSFGGLMSGLKLAFQVLFMIHKTMLKPQKTNSSIEPAESAATKTAPAVQNVQIPVREVQVAIPAGAHPGMSMSVATPVGSTMVTIPPGAVAGQTIIAKY